MLARRGILALIFITNICVSIGQTWVQKGNSIYGLGPNSFDGFSVSINSDGSVVAIGATTNTFDPGYARVFQWNGTDWVQKGATLAYGASFDWYGYSVEISGDGNTLAVGIPNQGIMQVYEWDGSSWIQKGGSIPSSGKDIDMTPDGSLIVTCHNTVAPTGENIIKTYQWDGFSWIQVGSDMYGEQIGDEAGVFSVGIDHWGTAVIFGAPSNSGNGPNAGNSRVFTGGWTQLGTDIDGQNPGDNFGQGVSINSDGSTIAIGAWNGNPYYSQVYDFDGFSNSWIQRGGDLFIGRGEDVELDASGDRIIIDGVVGLNGVVFDWDGASWNQFGQTIPEQVIGDQGRAVSISHDGNTIAVGAHNHDSPFIDAGYTRIYSVCWETFNTMNVSSCAPYTVPSGDETYALSGLYYDTLLNISGCDSILTIDLTIGSPNNVVDVVSACDSYTWIDGNTYTTSTNTPTWTLLNQAGCDSVITLDLTITNSNSVTDVITSCDSYSWIDGNTYTSSTNSPTWTLTNQVGCDSLVTLDLTITNSNTGIDVITACNSYTWIDGNTYTSNTNTQTWALTNQAGCDSVVTLILTINTVNNSVAQLDDTTLQANTIGAQYQWLDCDNNYAVINGETNQTFYVSSNGSYAVEVTENGCVDTSACMPITTIGIIESEITGLIVSPNPTVGEIDISLGTAYDKVSLRIYDAAGRLVQEEYLEYISKSNLLIDQPPGPYTLEIIADTKRAVVRIVKQ